MTTMLLLLVLAAEPTSNPLKDIVRIEFSKHEYLFSLAEVAQGVVFDYKITVANDIAGVVPTYSESACYGDNHSGLYAFEVIAGNDESYSLEDCGLGPEPDQTPRKIRKGVYKVSYMWDGKNWTGPSDFCQEKGRPFPRGEYKLSVTIEGQSRTKDGMKPYTIIESVPVKLVE